MPPKSDHEEDMSMEEILASIRKFVTDSPPEDPKPRVYKGDVSESVVIPPAGHAPSREQAVDYPQPSTAARQMRVAPSHYDPYPEEHPQQPIRPTGQPISRAPQTLTPPYEPYHEERPPQPLRQPMGQPIDRPSPISAPPYESDILELKSPILPTRSTNLGSLNKLGTPAPSGRLEKHVGHEESIMTLTNAIDEKKAEKPARFPGRMLPPGEQEATLGSSHALEASANALSRLANASKSALHKKTSNLADQRDLTLDQLIQDMIRPMIKLWIDTNLPSLVEEMVAKEIKRITNHLK